ncbi:MAG: imidazole glycerol phosphate synthase subunit HisH [Clostridiales bacterium]|nr:imidazole glycerol phosphate synthase subunit HisH [Clostridiales bacterium]
MIAIIDYGVGNLYSLSHSLSFLGIENEITREEKAIEQADQVILPGVGAFGDARKRLQETGMDRLVLKKAAEGTPLLGICLGMQLLFEKSYEYGEHKGLSLIPGEICPLKDDLPGDLKVPHIGWNGLKFLRESPLTKYIQEGDSVYYVHSYYAKGVGDALIAVSEYGVEVPGLVQKGNVFGAQFHPEKSGPVGLKILKAFGEVGSC